MTYVETEPETEPEPGGTPGAQGIEGADGADQLELYRTELTGYAYRMLGSAFEADDAVQETMIRAWRNLDRFEGRSSLRTWLYTIATRVCLDMLEGRKKRARPMEIGPQRGPDGPLGSPVTEDLWVTPVADSAVLPTAADPADLAVLRDSVRLAFIAALQHLPARQRAVLILREVLQWKAAEVADLLGDSVASVNSALQRARATLATRQPDEAEVAPPADGERRALVEKYVDAFERYDMTDLLAVLHEDVVLSMPPFDTWLQGHPDVLAWFTGHGIGCAGSRLLPVAANGGMVAFGQYRLVDGVHRGWAVQVLEVRDGKVAHLNAFLDVERLFPLFGLPTSLPR